MNTASASCTTRKAPPLRRLSGAAHWNAWQALWDLLLLPEPDETAATGQQTRTTISATSPTSEQSEAEGGDTA